MLLVSSFLLGFGPLNFSIFYFIFHAFLDIVKGSKVNLSIFRNILFDDHCFVRMQDTIVV